MEPRLKKNGKAVDDFWTSSRTWKFSNQIKSNLLNNKGLKAADMLLKQ